LRSFRKKAFPNIVPKDRLLIETPVNLNPAWLAGFTSGEACFFINMYKSETRLGMSVKLEFQFTLHARDEQLMISLIEYLGCGKYYPRLSRELGDYSVTKFSDLTEKIIPFFVKYPIIGVKSLDFDDWCKVAELMKEKKHLTNEGLTQIRKAIKAAINTGRKI